MKISGTDIGRVAIIDDDARVRGVYEYTVQDLDLRAVNEVGPLGTINEFSPLAASHAEAAICDHHLQVSNYARFNGAELVAHFYERKFPAILCTKWEEAAIVEMRRFRRNIPVLLKPDELDPDAFISGIAQCVEEFGGVYVPQRRPWRSLIRVEDFDSAETADRRVYVVVSEWDSDTVVSLLAMDLPPPVRAELGKRQRFHARVNAGATTSHELYFSDWEIA